MNGKYVIARCRDAGVHAGFYKSHTGREAVLTKARRLWRWKAADGATLSAVAVYGLDDQESDIGVELEEIVLADMCELIECSDAARESIEGARPFGVK